MIKLLYSLIALMFISTTANANIYDDCNTAIGANDLDRVKKLAATLQRFTSISPFDQPVANLCVSTALGKVVVFRGVKGFVNLAEEKIAQAAEAEAEAKAKAERLELETIKSKLTATITQLEKRTSCVRAKRSQTNGELEAINIRFEQSNKLLILDDTHEACTELYSSDQSAAMLNQTCIDAFKLMGHPNLVFSETEQRATFNAELSGLVALETSLAEELMEARVKLLETEGVVTGEDFNQQLVDDLEANSCAEFGYEGVYLD
jgi:hypothetical protein